MGHECSFILPNGRKCRCAATRNHAVCRHHAPKPAVPAPPPIPKSERYSDLIRWRRLGRNLAWLEPTAIAYTVWDILDCLIDRGPNSTGHISDRAAGRFLRALLNRLGEVPFPNPDFASPAPYPAAAPAPAPLDNRSAEAFLAAMATEGLVPPELLRAMPSTSSASLNQSRPRVNQ